MSQTEIIYGVTTRYVGKNGGYLMTGISITSYPTTNTHIQSKGQVQLRPIHSKNGIGMCMMSIPWENLDDVIEQLKKIKDDIK